MGLRNTTSLAQLLLMESFGNACTHQVGASVCGESGGAFSLKLAVRGTYVNTGSSCFVAVVQRLQVCRTQIEHRLLWTMLLCCVHLRGAEVHLVGCFPHVLGNHRSG